MAAMCFFILRGVNVVGGGGWRGGVYFVLKGFLPTLLGATDVLPIHRRRKDTVTTAGTRVSRLLTAWHLCQSSSSVAARLRSPSTYLKAARFTVSYHLNVTISTFTADHARYQTINRFFSLTDHNVSNTTNISSASWSSSGRTYTVARPNTRLDVFA